MDGKLQPAMSRLCEQSLLSVGRVRLENEWKGTSTLSALCTGLAVVQENTAMHGYVNGYRDQLAVFMRIMR